MKEKDRNEVKALSERREQKGIAEWEFEVRNSDRRESRQKGKSQVIGYLGEHAYCSRAVKQTEMLHGQTVGRTPRGVGETYDRMKECEMRDDPPLRLPS